MRYSYHLVTSLLFLSASVYAKPSILVSGWANQGVGIYAARSGQYVGQLAHITYPSGMSFGPDGNIYVADAGADQIRRYSWPNGDDLGAFISDSALDSPRDIVLGMDGNFYIVSYWADRVLRYDAVTGQSLGAFIDEGLSNPQRMTFGPDGNIYVASHANDKIQRYDGDSGAWLGTFVDAGALGLWQGPSGVAFGPDSNLYATLGDGSGRHVVAFDGHSGEMIGSFVPVGRGGLVDCGGIRFGQDRLLYVLDYTGQQTLRYADDSGDFVDRLKGGPGGGCTGILFTSSPVPGDLSLRIESAPPAADGEQTVAVDLHLENLASRVLIFEYWLEVRRVMDDGPGIATKPRLWTSEVVLRRGEGVSRHVEFGIPGEFSGQEVEVSLVAGPTVPNRVAVASTSLQLP